MLLNSPFRRATVEMSFWLAPEPATYTDLVQYYYTSLRSGILERVRACTSRGDIPAVNSQERRTCGLGKRFDILLLRFFFYYFGLD